MLLSIIHSSQFTAVGYQIWSTVAKCRSKNINKNACYYVLANVVHVVDGFVDVVVAVVDTGHIANDNYYNDNSSHLPCIT